MTQSLIRRLALEGAVRAVVVVESLPLLQPRVEFLDRGDDHSFELAIELLLVDPVRSLGLPVEVGATRPDIAVLDALIEDVPVELGPKFTPIVGLNVQYGEGQLGQDIVDEGDRGLLSIALEDLEDPKRRTVIDGGVSVWY